MRAVLSSDRFQVVFTDTPGFHKPRTLLGSRLNDLVGEATQGVDAVVQVVDAQAGVGRGDAAVFERQLRDLSGPKICAVNKLDLLRNREEVPQLEAAAALGTWDEIVPVSAKTGRGVGVLLDLLVDRLPEGPAYYPTDTITDQPLDLRLAEIVREKALAVARQEVPHSIAVRIDEIVDREDGVTEVHAIIFVERDSQKGIAIGKQGTMLKKVGMAVREKLGEGAYLELHVKVERDWQRRDHSLDRLGF